MAKSSHIPMPTDGLMGGLLIKNPSKIEIPQPGSNVSGTVIYVGKNEVYIDVSGLTTGIIRGRELHDESGDYSNLRPGDEIEATLLELENELGLMELSLRHAGHKKAWTQLSDLLSAGKTIQVPALDANKGGLMVQVGGVTGFLPVSQLTSQHYPRVEGGDKNKILELLKDLIGKTFDVKVIDVDDGAEKLIVSEKAAWEERQQVDIASYKAGDVIEGKVSGVVDFGVFIEFGKGLEGLVHISEMAWQRVDKPSDLYKPGEPVSARIIEIDGSKISLSIKRVKEDPWKLAPEMFPVGTKVTGRVLKVNPFGLFVELTPEIHGLAHISELSNKKIKDISQLAKPGDSLEFLVISVEPDSHRLGLSLRDKKEREKDKDKEKDKEPKEKESGKKKKSEVEKNVEEDTTDANKE